jgi:hypothetical protein
VDNCQTIGRAACVRMVPREVRTAIGKRCNSIGSTPVKHSSIKAPAGRQSPKNAHRAHLAKGDFPRPFHRVKFCQESPSV